MPELNLFDRIVKPSDCLVAFGIPTNHREFEAAVRDPSRNFTHLYNDLASRFETQFLSTFRKVESSFKELGVKTSYCTILGEFGQLIQLKRHSVVILFSHWDDDRVEFADGFAEPDQIVAQIPADTRCFLDLCVCHPEPLAWALNLHRPLCLVRRINCQATPSLWLEFYWALFRHLDRSNLTYTCALEEVAAEFLNAASEGKK